MWYVAPDGCIAECFIKYLTISYSRELLCLSVLGVLQDMGTDISNCRGQCYDNTDNLSGVYSGLQACIKQVNPLIEWVPCTAHTLNLGVNSVNYCLETEEFFNLVQTIFNFSSKSTSRWQTITAGLQLNDNQRIETLKCLSDMVSSCASNKSTAPELRQDPGVAAKDQ